MPTGKKYYCWLLVMLTGSQCLLAQKEGSDSLLLRAPQPGIENPVVATTVSKASLFVIRKIVITGNRKTKSAFILREIPLKEGEEYLLPDLVEKFKEARRQLMNTSLFSQATVAVRSIEGYSVDVWVDVKERWYIFPLPYFKPVDRNLNQWIVEQKASLSRVNYGVKFLCNNTTGYNDKLQAWLLNGYTKQVSFNYDRLYIDKGMKWGMNIGFAMGKNREVNYNTIYDKQAFFKDDRFIRKFVHAKAEASFRPAIKTRHYFGFAFTDENVKDTVVALNPLYFKKGNTSLSFPELYYHMTYYDLDYIPYPTRGYAAELAIAKRGFNKKLNVWQLTVKGSGSWHLAPKTFVSLSVFGTVKLPFKQPYFNQRLLGYDDVYMQGYEYYVIDGVAGGLCKATVARELLNFKIRVPQKTAKEPSHIPVRVFGKIYGNAGYVYHEQPGTNTLSNRMLYSGGLGIDILSLYDFTLKLEWTFNQLGQNGLFLHRKSIF